VDDGTVRADETDVKEFYKPFDFGLAMGAGLDIKAGPGRVILEYRFTLGFLDNMEPIDVLDESIEIKSKNMAMSILVGYGIDIGEK